MKSWEFRKLTTPGQGFVQVKFSHTCTLTASTAYHAYLRVPFNCKIDTVVIKASVAGGTPAPISLKQNKASAGSTYIPNMVAGTFYTAAQMTALGITPADLSGNCILAGGANLAAGTTVATYAVATAVGALATVDTDTTLIRTNREMKEGDLLCIDIAAQGTGTPTVEVDILVTPTA